MENIISTMVTVIEESKDGNENDNLHDTDLVGLSNKLRQSSFVYEVESQLDDTIFCQTKCSLA